MAINIYDTYTMLEAVKIMPPRSTFLRDRYFPTAAEDIFETENVMIDYEDEAGNHLAPVVLPHVGGIPMAREGYETEIINPPTIAPKMGISADQIARRTPGENVIGGLSPQERSAKYLNGDLKKMTAAIDATEEYMAAQCLQNNGYVLKQYADKYGSNTEYVEKTLRFYNGNSNPAVYNGQTKWDAQGADIIGDIAAMADALTKRGLPASDMIVGSDVADVILQDATILKLLDNRRFILAREVNPKEQPDGSTLIAEINAKGHNVRIFSYTREYQEGSTISPYIGAKNVVVTAPGCGRTAYGAVTQIEDESSGDDFVTYAAKRVPQVIVDRNANSRELIVRSKPVVMPKVRNPYISWQALT